MANINKNYLVIVDVKKSSISLGNGSMTFNILDKNTSNIFVNLVINTSTNELIHRFTNIENAEDYTVVMNIVKPNNEYLTLEGELRDKEKAVFEFNLPAEAKDVIGTYNCELLTKCEINGQEEVTTSNKVSYRVKQSVLNDLDDVITEAPTYPIVIELLDRLSDIERYEEDRRQAEIVRELAETARVEAESIREQEHDVAIQDIEDKIAEVEDRAKVVEEDVANAIEDMNVVIDNRFAQHEEKINITINAHEEEIKEKLGSQDTTINKFINDSNVKMDTHEQVVSAQIAEVQAKDREQDERMSAIEVVNSIQDERLDKVEKKNKEQDYTLACLFAETDRAEINFDGNSEQLLNSKDGLAIVNSFKGNTMVNLNKDADKSLVLNGNIDKQGQSVDVTEGADGGLVDVYLEGNTMVNVCDQEDSVPLTMSYTSTEGNRVAFQGEYDGKAKPYVYGNTLVNLVGDGETYKWPQQATATRDGDYVIIDTTQEGYEKGNIVVSFDSSMLKPSTTYTIIFKELGFDSKNVIIRDHTANSSFINVKLTDKNYHVFTTLPTQSTEYLIYYAYLQVGEKARVANNIVILEGDYTNQPIPNYFEGLQSSFEDQVVPANLFDMDFVNSVPRYTVDNEGYITYDRNNVTGYNYLDLHTNKKDMIKPNTKYTVFIDIKEFTLDTYFYFNGVGALIDNGVVNEKINKPGTYVYTLTTASDISSKQYGYFFNTQTSTQGKITFKIAIVEGDYSTWNITDFDNAGKYKVDYVSTGKNLFNKSSILEGYEITSVVTGEINLNAEWYVSDFIPVEPNTEYICTGKIKGKVYLCYDRNKNFIKGESNLVEKLTTPSECFYIKMNGLLSELETFQLEEGITATAYEPFKQTTKTLYLNSPLLEGDSIEVSGNNIVHVHRYAKVVFDGSADEGWIRDRMTDYYTDGSFIATTYNHLGLRTDTLYATHGAGICDTLVVESMGYTINSNTTLNRNCYSNGWKQHFICLKNISTLEQVEQWLSENPATVIYPLETPTYEVISSNDNLYIDSYVSGHLDFDTAVPVEKVEFKCFSTYLTYLNPNTQYLVQFEADNDGTLLTSYIGSQGRDDTVLNFSKGLVKFNITNSEGSSIYFALRGIGCNISNIVVTEATDLDFGYFKGMKSVGECEQLEVRSKNKNLFDMQGKGYDYWFPTGWNAGNKQQEYYPNGFKLESNLSRICISKKLDFLKKGKTYRISFTVNNAVFGGGGNSKLSAYATEIDRPNYYHYVVLNGNTNGRYYFINRVGNVRFDLERIAIYFQGETPVSSAEILDITIDEVIDGYPTSIANGGTPLDYIPHQSQTQQLTHEPLRAVGDVKDRYVLIDGEWYVERNCGEVKLGTLNPTPYPLSNNYPDVFGFYYNFDKIKEVYGYEVNVCCNILPTTIAVFPGGLDTNIESIRGYGAYIKGCINKNRLSEYTEKGLTDYFNSVDATLIYELLTPTYEPIEYNPLSVYKDMAHISTNSTIPANLKVKNHGFNALLKPSTTYTIASNQGVQTFATGAEIDDSLRLYGEGAMKDVRVLEGAITDTDLIPSHFSGIESVFEQHYDEEVGKYKVEIKTTGKNLWQYGDEITNGTVTHKATKPIFKKGHTYTISCQEYYKQYDHYPTFVMFRENDSSLDAWNLQEAFRVTPSEDIYIVRIYSNSFDYLASKGKPMTLKGLMIEEGTTATAYEPYKSSTISFYLDEPLRGIGDVRDRVFIENGELKVERKVRSILLNGSEDWQHQTAVNIEPQDPKRQIYRLQLNDSYPFASNFTPNLMTDGYAISWNQMLMEIHDKGIGLLGNGQIRMQFYSVSESTNEDREQALAELKQYLSENPTTVVYQLAEPTIEEIELDKEKLFLESYKDGHISFNSNIPVMDTWVEYSVAVAMLDNMLETASITDEQDFLIVDLATQLAIMQLTM